MEKLLTPEQAGKKLGIGGAAVRYYLRDGTLRGLLIGSRWVVPASALAEFSLRPRGRPATKTAR